MNVNEKNNVLKEEGQAFECFSKKLFGFLTMNGVRYERSYKHNTTQRTCWIYVMTPELSELLVKWKESKPAV